MLLTIAWKNIWRSKRRSLIMICAITLGLWGGLFAVGLFTGMYDTVINSAIDRNLTHLQLHVKGFREERLITMAVPDPDSLCTAVRAIAGVQAVSPRTIIDGMGSSTTSSEGLTIVGIVPTLERQATGIARHMVAGTFFEGRDRLPIVIGRKLAERLSLKTGGKIVLSFQRPDATIVYGAFRIAGLFDTESTAFDGMTVFVQQSDLDGLLGARLIHEIAIRLTTDDSLASARRQIAAAFPSLQLEDWQELAPELKLVVESSDLTDAIFLGIILLALLFGVTNTMLMSVLERVREFGLLMAVGMKRGRIFLMIILETVFLSLTGSAAGVLLGSITVAIVSRVGIDLAWVSEGLSLYGISTMLYPVLHVSVYPTLGLMVMLAAVIAAVYPALKAVRLHPASALATFG
jgi:ABC-type lipoprotein release transport system permease subunit